MSAGGGGPNAAPAAMRLRIRGRVQGVWYRGATREQALGLGLVGYAKNLGDGSVEVFAQGPSAALDQLAAWCADGPPGERVDRVEREREGVVDAGLAGFRVL